jgi:hypothetical protein
MKIKTMFYHKMSELEPEQCEIEKIIELPRDEFLSLLRNPLKDRDFISENNYFMRMDKEGVYHCLLALGEEYDDGILIESEGYDYARKCAFIPNARQIVNQPQYQNFKDLDKRLLDAVEDIMSRYNSYEYEEPYRVLIDELIEDHHFDKSYVPIFIEMLKEYSDASDIEMVDDEIFIYKNHQNESEDCFMKLE